MATFTVEGARSVDREAIEAWGLPGLVLMENAARAVEAAILDVLELLGRPPAGTVEARSPSACITIVCGGGNNGGDGWAVARHLDNRRRAGDPAVPPVRVIEVAEAREDTDAGVNARIARRMGIPVVPADDWLAGPPAAGDVALLVDALLGTGADRPLVGRVRAIVEVVNDLHDRGVPVLAVDLPSGFDADGGGPLPGSADDEPIAVRADVTVSFVGPKLGMERAGAGAWTGRVVTGDIGVPHEVVRRHAVKPGG